MMTMSERNEMLDALEYILSCGLMEAYKEQRSMSNWAYGSLRGYDYESGATKCVLIPWDLDWVIKFNYPGEKNDYCSREYENYVAAEEAGYAKYFAEVVYLYEVDGLAFYAQRKVVCEEYEADSRLYDSLRRSYEEDGRFVDEDTLWNEVEDLEAADRVTILYDDFDFGNFIMERRINDLHSANFGIYNDDIVIIDFSGFGCQVFG